MRAVHITTTFPVFYRFADSVVHFSGSLVTPTRGGEQRDALTKDNIVLRGCVVRNTDYIEGIVAYAGHETKVSSRAALAAISISDLKIRDVFD